MTDLMKIWGVNGPQNITREDPLPADFIRMSKGGVVTVFDGIEETATSDAIDCSGFNSLLVHVHMSEQKNWTIKILGSLTKDGDYVEIDGSTKQTSKSLVYVFRGIPDNVKIEATEDADGAALTVHAQPLNA